MIADARWRLERLRTSRYVPVFPEPKQAAFILCNTREAMYGGAAGGGKSVALLTAALEWVDFPEYSALLLRRNYQDLNQPKALIPLSQEWLSETDARWNDNDKRWTFPSGATLTFGYMAIEKDKYRYQGAAYHFVGWDELTQFSEGQYRYLFSRQRRSAGSDLPIRMRSTSNPGGDGHDWVKARFVDPGSLGRPFFPAFLKDNPHLDQAEYVQSMDELDPITRRQLLHGDWGARPSGGWFEPDQFDIVPEAPAIVKAIRYWDMAATVPKPGTDPDWTVGLLLGLGADNLYYILDVLRFREAPANAEQIMRRTAWDDNVYNATIWIEQEPGASGVIAADHIVRNVLVGQSVFVDKKERSKADRARPVAAQAARKTIRLVSAPWNLPFLDELQAFPFGGHDDQVDALSGAFAKLMEDGVMVFSMADRNPQQITGWEGYSLDNPLGVK